MPADNEVYRHALSLPNGAPQSFFSALSGESHASAIGVLQGAGGQARSVPLSHLRANLGAGLRAGSPTASVGTSDAAPASSVLPTSAAQPAWAELVGNWQRLGASSETSEVRVHTGGVFAGADGAIGAGWRLGGALGYTDSNLRTDGVDGKTDISSYSAIVYGGKAFDVGAGKVNLLLGGSYTWHDINSKRRIAVGGLDQTLRADYGASTTQLFTELGYAIAVGQSLSVEPYAGLAWADLRSRAFRESCGSAALSGASQNNQTTTTTLGVRGRQALTLDKFEGSITAGAGWRHAFGDLNPTTKMAFDAGNAFTVAGAPIARNAALLEADFETSMGRSGTVGLSYAGQFGSGTQDHSATLAARWAF
jgi:outer membrane autotransporter protein